MRLDRLAGVWIGHLKDSFETRPRLRKALKASAIFLLLAAVLFVIWELLQVPWQNLGQYLPPTPWLAALALVGLYLAKTVLVVIPLNALYLTSSLLFPPLWAILISLTGLYLESTIGFAIGRYSQHGQVRTRLESYRFSRWLLGLADKRPALSCFAFRFMPPPADLTNVFFGATRLSYPSFLFASLLGFLPKLLLVIFAGEAALEARAGTFAALAAALLVVEFLPMLIAWLWNRRSV
jgi:uncharacterized membrane protein YdjX (TVP38/TMEM64 family)